MITSTRNIILVTNILFKNNDGEVVDHAWKTGRPSIIIAEKEHSYYILTMSTHFYQRENNYPIHTDEVDWNTMHDSFRKKDAEVNFNSIKKIRIYSRKELGVMDELYYYRMLSQMLNYYKSIPYFPGNPERFEIMDELEQQVTDIEKKLIRSK